jgi:hypothetical protein
METFLYMFFFFLVAVPLIGHLARLRDRRGRAAQHGRLRQSFMGDSDARISVRRLHRLPHNPPERSGRYPTRCLRPNLRRRTL